MALTRCYPAVIATVVGLLATAELSGQHLPGSAKSPRRALAWSAAGTLLPIAAGVVVLATRPRGDPASGEPADETYDVVGGILIGLGVGFGPSLGHFYAHEQGWLLPRVLVGGVLGLAAAASDLGSGAALAILGGTAVTVMAARDIASAPLAAKRFNQRRLGLVLGVERAREEHKPGLRLGIALEL